MKPLTPDLLNKVKNLQDNGPSNRLIYNSDENTGKNEFLFFIKPELTLNDNNIRFDAILDLILSKIDEFSFKIKSIRVINALYLEKYNIIAQHYGVINKLSANIKQYIAEEAKTKFEEIFKTSFKGAEVLGSLEFLKEYNHFTPTGLSYLWQNNPSEKLAGGTYAQKLLLDGKAVYLVNGFHPRQLEHFIAKGRTIIAMTLISDTSWKTARNSFIGKTNPAESEPGSIRNELLNKRSEFGLSTISSSWNGVHLSAGPIEGLVELIRYNSDFENNISQSPADYTFGRKLLQTFCEEKTKWLLENPFVSYNQKQSSVFDLTEELESDECIDRLKTIL